MDWRCVITCFAAGIFQTVLVSSHFTAFPHEHPHKDNLYHNPQPQTYHPQPVTYHEPAQPAVEPHPTIVKAHEPVVHHAGPVVAHPHQPVHSTPLVHPHQQPYHMRTYGYHIVQQPSHYQQPHQYQPHNVYQPYQPYHQPQPAYPAQAHPVHPVTEAPAVPTPAPVPETTPAPVTTTTPAPAAETPKYLGTFKNPSHGVKGDIFMLDQSTLYIQGFSFDGEAPDPYFWSDGVPIPYYTRSDRSVTMSLKKVTNEDVVLMLPAEKPTLEALGHFQVWCKMFDVVFGEFDMKDAWHA